MYIPKFIKNILNAIPVSNSSTLLEYLHNKSIGFFFEVHIVDHCNLNCKGCSHYSPLSKEKYLDFIQYSNDMHRMSELLGKKVRHVHLLGGEPLLSPQIIDFMMTAAECFPKAKIDLITNGILLPAQSEEFWQACRKYNIYINITKYPIKIDYPLIESIAATHDVHLQYYYDAKTLTNFRKDVLDSNGLQNPQDSYNHCNFGGQCNQLKDGKLFICAQSAYIQNINDYFHKDFKVSDKDWIDIYKVKSGKELIKFTKKPVPFCRYCAVKARDISAGWGISKKDVSEWFDS